MCPASFFIGLNWERNNEKTPVCCFFLGNSHASQDDYGIIKTPPYQGGVLICSYLSLAIILDNRLFFLEALFLWITCFLAALSKADMAFFMASMASLFLPASTNFLTSLTAERKTSLVLIFLTLRRKLWRMAFMALLVLGI